NDVVSEPGARPRPKVRDEVSASLALPSIATRRLPSRTVMVVGLVLVAVLIAWLVLRSPGKNVVYKPLQGLPAGSGEMNLTATLSPGGPRVDTPTWHVYEARPDPLGNRKEVATGYTTKQQFT